MLLRSAILEGKPSPAQTAATTGNRNSNPRTAHGRSLSCPAAAPPPAAEGLLRVSGMHQAVLLPRPLQTLRLLIAAAAPCGWPSDVLRGKILSNANLSSSAFCLVEGQHISWLGERKVTLDVFKRHLVTDFWQEPCCASRSARLGTSASSMQLQCQCKQYRGSWSRPPTTTRTTQPPKQPRQPPLRARTLGFSARCGAWCLQLDTR